MNYILSLPEQVEVELRAIRNDLKDAHLAPSPYYVNKAFRIFPQNIFTLKHS